ncbi:LOW QUALITY PROTEIN: Fanconi anemia group M protein [Xyrichtys novacula]|uniref:ATP-dependent RNA helicase FANCM n=1 Tax=Xyrichtys novacula TaxID=13765 RepID=A0AAV1GHE7_XYRNO|nr:LOW QUALITY PROTEIN: Fanconi anemia group M protein [Xyrichtys novacula]
MKMSSGPNQRTLFQTWGAPAPQNSVVQPKKDGKKAAGRRKATSSNTSQVAKTHPPTLNPLWTQIGQSCSTAGDPKSAFGDEDDDDDLMLVAVYEAEQSLEADNANTGSYDNKESIDPSPVPSAGRTYPDFPGFDSSSAKVWIYPTNYPIREYQLKISEAALFQNSLVCLPTGLGKTFIASVVMYNFYRWYSSGKIVFMAPTKPLVAQQIEACYKVMGIPQEHMAELTGSTAAKQRQEVWRTKRVFFLTPQVMVNDLSRETCPAQQIKCVVIDEAHKALGNHAYCQVIRQLSSQTLQFRVLALSATPGGDTKSVQSVISNLLISHIELRSEESPDIQAHSHQRSVEKMVVPLGEALSAQQARYIEVLEKFMSRLVQNRVMAHKDLRTLSKYQIILARDQFRKNPPPHIKGPQQGMLEGDFALCISLYHGYELLMQMGLRSLFFYIQGIMDGSKEMSRARNELQRTPTFMELYQQMEAMFLKPPAGPDEPFIHSHPKLEKLEGVVLQHFKLWAERSADNTGPQEVSTRVMIFSSFRESVQEIAAMLDRHAPLIRVMTFMGQASAGKGVKGFTQKEQLEVVNRFRTGGFNTLVSTCVGEEGLDIGEVDLIVCFDAQKNPIRLVQRMGRTGRKRQGRIVVILAEGREERTYNQSQSIKRSVHKSIISNKNSFHMYPNSPRMLPDEVNPTLHKMHITCGQFDHQQSSNRCSTGGRRSRSEGRLSLIHPHNLILQGSATSDGFLSSTEYSLWASTMKLQEDESQPTLKQSHFMSLPCESSPQEDIPKSGPPSRELSLWEWRHWQHKVLPTHAVDHSLRCYHFRKVMELIDSMREENEGDCKYEQDLLPFLQKDDSFGIVEKKQKKVKSSKTCAKATYKRHKPSHSTFSDLEWIDEEEEMQRKGLISEFIVRKKTSPLQEPCDDFADQPGSEAESPNFPSFPPNNDYPEASTDDCFIASKDAIKPEKKKTSDEPESLDKSSTDEDVELQAMFYLPKWASSPLPSSVKLTQTRDASLKIILANVAELLSRSPPSLPGDLEADMAAPSPPQRPQQLFRVSFTLDVDDDDDDVVMSDTDEAPLRVDKDKHPEGEVDNKKYHDWPLKKQEQSISSGKIAAESPTWEEVFEDEELDMNHDRNDQHMEVDDERVCDIEGENGEDVKKIREEMEEKGSHWDGGVLDNVDPQTDESMDLFGDDEAFMQMTIPEISTPGVTSRKSPNASDITDSTTKMSNTLHNHMPMNPCSTAHPAYTADLEHTKHVTHSPHTELITDTHGSAEGKQNPESSDRSHDYFSVNFDLGYSLEESEEEVEEDVPAQSTSPLPKKRALSNSSTPYNNSHRQIIPPQSTEAKLSKLILSEQGKRETSSPLAPPLMLKGHELPSPIPSPTARQMLGYTQPHSPPLLPRLKRRRLEGPTEAGKASESVCLTDSPPQIVRNSSSESEDDVVVQKRRHRGKVNPLSSPEVSKICSDVDSPLIVTKKRSAALIITDETESGAISDDDFSESVFTHRPAAAERRQVQRGKAKRARSHKGRQFLDEEAELSEEEEGVDVSSDEEDGCELNQSLDGFVVDNTHLSQGLNDSEMCGVYLKSVRSPAVHGKFKMSYRNHHNMDIFSQVPEMDETYAEDSFVVGSEVEEAESSEEEEEDIELLPEVSYVDGRKQYATRRRVFIHKARAKAKTTTESAQQQTAGVKPKRSRVRCIQDSSEDEAEEAGKKGSVTTEADAAAPLWPKTLQPGPSKPQEQQKPPSSSSTIASKVSKLSKAQRSSMTPEEQNERYRQRFENQHLLSDELDFAETDLRSSSKKSETLLASSSVPQTTAAQEASVSEPPAPPGPVGILADSRCISSGVELMACLRQRHSATVHVCSLDGSYFIVSNRMAVERHSQSDLSSTQNRKRLTERVNSLQGLFERVCLIVEKDRTKQGEASRPFQRTRYYDNTLTALVRTGVRLLWSSGPEESAGLLSDLARLEQRKGQGIAVPLEVKGQRRQQALELYSSLPSVNHAHALNMSHNFSSIAQLINSSVEAIQKGGCMSQSRAEEVYRFLRYSCDSLLLNTLKTGKS